MIHTQATDLPELRASLLEWTTSETGRHYWSWRREMVASSWAEMGESAPVTESLFEIDEELGTAELFFVTPPMVDLAIHSSKSLPDFVIMPEDLPAPRGFLISPQAFSVLEVEEGDVTVTYQIHGFAWTVHPAGYGVKVSWLVDREKFLASSGYTKSDVDWFRSSLPQVYERWTSFWMYDSAEPEDRAEAAASEAGTNPALILKSTWLLMQQPVTLDTVVEYDRATRKRLVRKSIDPPPVRVITLRRTASTEGSLGQLGHGYHHQWIVRGHWRQQWYPLRQVHRPVWIAPHLKGPEGAPLIGGEKVHAWRR